MPGRPVVLALSVAAAVVAVCLAAVALGSAARVEAPTTPTGGQMDSVARTFLATSGPGIEMQPGDVIKIVLVGGQIRAKISCNETFADYVVSDGLLVLSNAGTTAMLCPPDRAAQDDQLGQTIGSEPKFTLDGSVLTLESSIGTLRLIDALAPNPDDCPVIGTAWTLVGLVMPGGGSRLDTRETVTFRFGEGKVEVRVSCRSSVIDASVDESAKSVTFDSASETATIGVGNGLRRVPDRASVVPTSVAPAPTVAPTTTSPPGPPLTFEFSPTTTICDPNVRSEWELQVLAALIGTMSVEVDIDELHLRAPDGSGFDLAAATAGGLRLSPIRREASHRIS